MSSGNTLAMLNLDGFKIGIGICYDIRFEELARIYRNNGNQPIYHFSSRTIFEYKIHWNFRCRYAFVSGGIQYDYGPNALGAIATCSCQ